MSSSDADSGHDAAPSLARYASVHWIRYPAKQTAEELEPVGSPTGSISWKIGADGLAAPDGTRLPSEVWCAVGLFLDEASARSALLMRERFLPRLASAVESWHAAMVPVAHKGECNHLDRARPGRLFEGGHPDPGGPLFVMTTAGFNLGPEFDLNRVVSFRRNVDRVRDWMRSASGLVASQVFTPHVRGDDGVTMSLWTDDVAMSSLMYRAGDHRAEIDRYKSEQTADRTSFTRFRVAETCGTWGGVDPFAVARGVAQGNPA